MRKRYFVPLQATGRTAAGLVGAVGSAIAIVSFSSIASNRLILPLRLGFSLTQNKISYLTKLNNICRDGGAVERGGLENR